jgi:hypothetical protein
MVVTPRRWPMPLRSTSFMFRCAVSPADKAIARKIFDDEVP